MFDLLLQSVQEGGEILRGEKEPASSYQVDPIDVKKLRKQLGLSRTKLAAALSVSERTIESWEQGRRNPSGSDRKLMTVIHKHPELLTELLSGA